MALKWRNRLYVDIADILALRLECSKCGAAVSVKPSELTVRLTQCPNCLENWDGNGLDGLGLVMNFLRELHVSAPETEEHLYRLQFEIEVPNT